MSDHPQRQPLFPNSAFDVVTIAASAGGVKALSQLLPAIPSSFPGAMLIILHIDPQGPSLLADILNRCSPLTVRQARDGDSLRAGAVYTASPDYHLLVQADNTLHLTHTDRVNFARPAADCTLQSVAEQFGQRAIAVILSGSGHDGAAGVRAIKAHGGRVLVQDPATAAYGGMPQAAVDTQQVDWVLPLGAIAPKLMDLCYEAGVSLDQ